MRIYLLKNFTSIKKSSYDHRNFSFNLSNTILSIGRGKGLSGRSISIHSVFFDAGVQNKEVFFIGDINYIIYGKKLLILSES